MKGRLAAGIERQAAEILPGAMFAYALVIPLTRHRVLWHLRVEEVYFELHDVIVYASDLVLLLVIAAWLASPSRRRVGDVPRWLLFTLAGLPVLAALSALWAPYPYLAAFQAVRLALLFGLFLAAATARAARGALLWGLLVSGAIQAAIGIAQFVRQAPLGLPDLGEIFVLPGMSGASVVTASGAPTLRAYGLAPHPNLLGGLLMAAMLTGAGLTLAQRPSRWPAWTAASLTTVSFAGLLASFSRSAWLGAAVGGTVMLVVLLFRRCGRAEVAWRIAPVLAVVLGVVGGLFIATQWPLLRGRLGLAVEGVEIRSVDERSGLEAAAGTLIREHPLLGVGYGNFALALFDRQPPAMADYPIYQPVHRTPLLAQAELGLPGALAWLLLAGGPWVAVWRRRRSWPAPWMPPPHAAAGLGILAGLTVIGMFDFYPWYSVQGRPLAWLCYGLVAQSFVIEG